MGYGSDDRDGNRWRDRDDDGRWSARGDRDWRGGGGGSDGWNEGRRERSGWGPSSGRGGDDRGGGGFFERAGDEVRSWFGGSDDDHRGRGGDRQRDEERSRGGGGRSGQDHEGGSYGWMSGGWGNQAGESWNRDRPGVREEREDREGWFSASQGGERGERWGGREGRLSSDRGHQSGWQSGGSEANLRQGGLHDPHYSQWRRRQIEELDRDYDEYRREHQSKFEQEFGNWRSKRQGQRQMMGGVREQMEVLGSDGNHLGTVDKVAGDRIILTRSDPNAGGVHHSVPCGWVETVEGGKVTLNRTAEQAMSEWRDEDSSRALFERREQGSEGPHVLNRSFSGTYKDGGGDQG